MRSSGVSVHDDVITQFGDFKLKRAPYNYRYFIYKIENDEEIVVESTGASTETYEDFVGKLLRIMDECRYALIDLDVTMKDGRPNSKFVFRSWSPDTARIKSKMLYASSRLAIKHAVAGVGFHLTATDASELARETIEDKTINFSMQRVMWRLAALAVLAVLAALGAGLAGAQECASPAKTLTLSCGDSCEPFAPCLLQPDSSACDVECFTVNSTSHSAYSTFWFLVPFGAAAGDAMVTASKPASALAKVDKLKLPSVTTSFIMRGGNSLVDCEKGHVVSIEFADSFLADNDKMLNVRLANVNLAAVLTSLLANLPVGLRHLWLQNTLLTEFPDASRFTGLGILNLEYNYLTTVNKTHESLVSSVFHTLYLLGNNLTSFTATFPNLIHLDLSYNQLLEVPPQIYELSKVGTVILSANKITEFKYSRTMSNMRTLLIDKNKVTAFDAVMPNLDILHIGGNDFTELPFAIFKQGKLKDLHMKDLKLLRNVQLTNEQANFFATLRLLEVDQEIFSSDCAASQQVLVNGFTVCITGGDVNLTIINGARVVVSVPSSSRNSTKSSSSSGSQSTAAPDVGDGGGDSSSNTTNASDSSNTTVIVAAIISAVGVLVVALFAGYKIWKQKRAASEAKGDGASDDTSTSSKMSNDASIWNDPDMLSVKLNLNDITDVKVIGQGGFCIVWLVTYCQSQQLASKRLKKVTRSHTLDFIDEIKLVAALQHPRIVEFVGAAWSKEADLQALFEFVENGDLRAYLEDPNTPHAWSLLKVQFAVDVAEALVYVHSFNPPLLHRDLKSRNVLLSARWQAKLTDFGVSRYQSERSTMTMGVGTSRWLAPEVISGSKDYGPAADVFSFGVVLSELDSHALPYSDARAHDGSKLTDIAVMQMVSTGDLRLRFSRSCPPTILELAQLCTALRPEDRPTAPELAYALRSYKKVASDAVER